MRSVVLILLFGAAVVVGALELGDACNISAPLATSRAALPPDTSSDTVVKPSDCPSGLEDCVCAAMRLGWNQMARSLLITSGAQTIKLLRVRRFAEAQAHAASSFLARLHPRYPLHLKVVPALLWAQTEDILAVRVRFARYTVGESLASLVEEANVTLTTDELYFAAESAFSEKPGFFETGLRWAHPLAALHPSTSACPPNDRHELCETWAAKGECDNNRDFMHKECIRACGLCDAEADKGVAPAAVWEVGEGEVVFEARKASKGPWAGLLTNTSLTAAKQVAYATELDATVGDYLRCREACPAELSPEPEAVCRAECRAHIKPISPGRVKQRPPRVAAGRATG